MSGYCVFDVAGCGEEGSRERLVDRYSGSIE